MIIDLILGQANNKVSVSLREFTLTTQGINRSMKKNHTSMQHTQYRAPRGFTLVEIIAVLVILSLLGSFAVVKFIDITTTAKKQKIYEGIAEYNSREKLLWGQTMLSKKFDNVYDFDRDIYANMDPFLDPGHTYSSGTETDSEEGDNWDYTHKSYGDASNGRVYKGTLTFQGVTADLERTPATYESPASWKITGYDE